MSKQNRRNRSREWPGQRQRQDPWRAAAEKVRRSNLPASAKALSDHIQDLHRDNPLFSVIRIGYGGRVEWLDHRGRTHHCKPGLAEGAGCGRRTMIDMVHLLVEGGYYSCVRGGGMRTKYVGRGGRGAGGSRAGRPELRRWIGNGGCVEGGAGAANEYAPFGAPAEPPPPSPEAEEPIESPSRPNRSLAQEWERQQGGRGP